ncbi:MAG: tRNA glutamyl-Q(34) synthetase GluQRS [Desulfuromonas sp.]|nr:MAG: tRNA glutamyl-Q(34) synthetase GluQRS [Desulfuromonas sp.]
MPLTQPPQPSTVGRFAPSPTGPLHFGSLVAAVGSYCLARRAGGRWLLRMEDLDTPRVVPGAADAILRTLQACGFTWDGEIVWQSRRLEAYQAALERLQEKQLVFPCGCSRQEIVASAPHAGDEGPVYSGTCRSGLPTGKQSRSVRLRVGGSTVCFRDGLFGPVEQDLVTAVGDFVLKRADGIFAYQLAVVVDDLESGVTQVVRGADLLSSTARQIYLYGCFDHAPPHYLHLPLALAPDGQKISKRHGAPSASAQDLQHWVRAAFDFLGQQLPGDLDSAPAEELLGWGSAHFDPGQVPLQAKTPGLAWEAP